MKLYNKKKLLIGIGELILSVVSIITMIVQKNSDIKFMILSLICLILGINSVIHAFSKSKTQSDLIEKLDERSNLIDLTVNNKLIKINTIIVLIFMIIGILVYSITRNIMVIVAILPFMLLLPLTFFIYIGLYFYYEKKM